MPEQTAKNYLDGVFDGICDLKKYMAELECVLDKVCTTKEYDKNKISADNHITEIEDCARNLKILLEEKSLL